MRRSGYNRQRPRITLPGPQRLISLQSGTFTRGSTATYQTDADSLASAASGATRWQDTGNGSGLLLEDSVENALLRNSEFDNGSWSKSGVTVTADQLAAPDETGTPADQIDYTSTSTDNILQDIGVQSDNTTWTGSLWLRTASGTKDLRLQLREKGGSFNSTNITVTATWQRFSHTVDIGAGGVSSLRLRLINNSPGAAGTVYAWGSQLEESSFPTSMIPTTTVAVTRSQDSLVIPSAAVPAAMLSGRWMWEFWPVMASGEDAAFRKLLQYDTGGNDIRLGTTDNLQVVIGGAIKASAAGLTWSRGQRLRLILDAANGTLETRGFTTGDGIDSGTAWVAPSGDIRVGAAPAGSNAMDAAFTDPVSA